MSLISGNGSSPEFSTSSIDTRIYGNPEEIRDAAAKVYELYDVLHDASYDMALPHAHYTEVRHDSKRILGGDQHFRKAHKR